MVEFSPDMLCAVDYNGCLRQVSPASQALLHYDSRDLLGRYLGDIIHPDDRAAALAQCAEARRAPGAVSFESRCLAATGQVVRIAWSVHWVAAEELLIGVGRRAQVAAGRPAAEATAVAAQRVMRQQAEAAHQHSGKHQRRVHFPRPGLEPDLHQRPRRAAAERQPRRCPRAESLVPVPGSTGTLRTVPAGAEPGRDGAIQFLRPAPAVLVRSAGLPVLRRHLRFSD